MLIDAAGNEVASDRCRCGRHKVASSGLCCRECPGTLTGRHAVGCHMRQEHFPDTRRGVVASPMGRARVVRTFREFQAAGTPPQSIVRHGRAPRVPPETVIALLKEKPASFSTIAARFGLTASRIGQIVLAYEQETGDRLPRQRRGRPRRVR